MAVQAAVKRNRSSSSPARPKSINRHLGARAKALAGLKGYVTNLKHPMAKYVVVAHHQLWQIGHSFRMSKTDLRARPIYTTGGAAAMALVFPRTVLFRSTGTLDGDDGADHPNIRRPRGYRATRQLL